MKRSRLFHLALWLGVVLCPAQAAPPSYEDLRADPEAMPMQPTWQLRPVDPDAPPWEDVFVFTLGTGPELRARSRWLSLNPGDDNARAPALFDTVEGRAVFLAPAARGFCDGRWRVVRVERIGVNAALQAEFKVWLVERAADGAQRVAQAYGRVDAQGRWAVPPKTCAGEDTLSADSPAALSYLIDGERAPAGSALRVDTVAGQPGLRDARGGWRAPVPQRDIATAQWMRGRRELRAPGSSAWGLIDTQGRTVIPALFDELPDAAAPDRIRLCTAAGPQPRLDAGTPRACRWQRLRGGDTGAAPRPVKDPVSDLWGYQDASGRWAIAPQFRQARAFRHGYAAVSGPYPQQWRPPGWQDSRPIVRGIQRMGRHWVVEAAVRNASTGGRWDVRYGLLNDAGQWLAPMPEYVLHIAVLFPRGGRSGYYAELLAEHLPKLLGREVQVDYRPDASPADQERLMKRGGNREVLLAAVRLPRAGVAGVHRAEAIDALLHALRPVTLLASQPEVLAIDSDKADALGIASIDNLLAYARAHPGALRVATGEDGWTGHLAFGQLRALSGVELRRVVFEGRYPDSDRVTQAHAAELLFAPVNGVAAAVRRGRLRVLGTAAEPAHPQRFEGALWPTLASSAALDGFAAYDRFSLWAPENSEAASNRALQEAVAQVLALPAVRKQLQDLQVVGGGGSPEQLLALEDEERRRWERVLSVPAPAPPPSP